MFGKRPELLQEMTGTMFFKARSQNFFEIFKKNFFRHMRHPQHDQAKLFFFVKKVCKKSLPIKFVVDFFSNKKGTGVDATEYEIYVTKYFLV